MVRIVNLLVLHDHFPIIGEGERIIYKIHLLFREEELTRDNRSFHEKTDMDT